MSGKKLADSMTTESCGSAFLTLAYYCKKGNRRESPPMSKRLDMGIGMYDEGSLGADIF